MSSGYAYPQVNLQVNAQQIGGNAQTELANQRGRLARTVAGSAPGGNAAATPSASYWSSDAPTASGNGAAVVAQTTASVSSATARLEGLVNASSGGRFGAPTGTPTPAPVSSPASGVSGAASPTPYAVSLPNGMRVEGLAPAGSAAASSSPAATPASVEGGMVVTLDNGAQVEVGPGASASPSPSSLELPP